METLLSVYAAEIGILAALIGVALSLFWNWLNWQRNKSLDKLTRRNAAAIRFEAVHGDTLRDVIELLDEISGSCSDIKQTSTTIEAVKSDLSLKLKPLISKSQNKLVLMVLDLGSSPLSRDKEKWKGLIDDAHWDSIWISYKGTLGADSISESVDNLDNLLRQADLIRHEIIQARAGENDLSL